MATVTSKCSCVSDFQDKTYGSGNRLHNTMASAEKIRCTVCGTERYRSGSAEVKGKKK